MLPCDTKVRLSNNKITSQNRIKRWQPPSRDYPQLPNGQVYAHLCFNKRCSEPTHIEIMTRSENFLMEDVRHTGDKYRFPCGHKRASPNLIQGKCRECKRIYNASRRLS